MEILRRTVLTDRSDLKTFKRLTYQKLNVDFPIEYFERSFVRAFKDRFGNIVGGYALVLSGPLRTLESLPETANYPKNPDHFFEVTALWLDSSFKSGVPSCQFWYQFSQDIFNQKHKKFFIYAYDLSNKKLKNLYALAKPQVLYQGPVKRLEGNTYDSVESIEFAQRTTLGLLPFYAFPNFIIKIVFRRKTYLKDLKLFSFLTEKS